MILHLSKDSPHSNLRIEYQADTSIKIFGTPARSHGEVLIAHLTENEAFELGSRLAMPPHHVS